MQIVILKAEFVCDRKRKYFVRIRGNQICGWLLSGNPPPLAPKIVVLATVNSHLLSISCTEALDYAPAYSVFRCMSLVDTAVFDTPIFGTDTWYRYDDPAVSSAMLLQNAVDDILSL